ncbi:MAG TPA: hypothetical protein VFV37_10065 [Luteibaculaceae bacterium]|nr:hypothetical protein [Luteibaculaceae bacterium]
MTVSITPQEKHHLIRFENGLHEKAIIELEQWFGAHAGDVIIDMAALREVEPATALLFGDLLESQSGKRLVILIGEEDRLSQWALIRDDFPVTPTYNEGMDYLFMLQLERELLDE